MIPPGVDLDRFAPAPDADRARRAVARRDRGLEAARARARDRGAHCRMSSCAWRAMPIDRRRADRSENSRPRRARRPRRPRRAGRPGRSGRRASVGARAAAHGGPRAFRDCDRRGAGERRAGGRPAAGGPAEIVDESCGRLFAARRCRCGRRRPRATCSTTGAQLAAGARARAEERFGSSWPAAASRNCRAPSPADVRPEHRRRPGARHGDARLCRRAVRAARICGTPPARRRAGRRGQRVERRQRRPRAPATAQGRSSSTTSATAPRPTRASRP